MPSGGRRPGAGAPKGNMNRLKHGRYSQQFAAVGALLASNPDIRDALLAMARKHNLRQERADEVAALLLTKLFQRAEEKAGGNLFTDPSDQPEQLRQRRVEGPVLSGRSGRGGHDRLNLELDVVDRDSIEQAAENVSLQQLESVLRRAGRKKSGDVQSKIRQERR